jgi:hypothetical protein
MLSSKSIAKLVLLAVVFYVLTPGTFFTLPPNGTIVSVHVTHAVVFALVWTFVVKKFMKSLAA